MGKRARDGFLSGLVHDRRRARCGRCDVGM